MCNPLTPYGSLLLTSPAAFEIEQKIKRNENDFLMKWHRAWAALICC